ncbi:MAG: MFS transporter [Chloroflexi bacterium]|nr:MAG: MFS transporter [Chloroflexota bacterium]
MHRIDEAFIEIEPVEAVIHNALHDEMSLQDSTLMNREELLNKLRRAVNKLAPEAAVYLNQQPPEATQASQAQQLPQDDQTKHNHLQATRAAMQNGDNPNENDYEFSNAIDSATQARTIIYEVRTTLHHFRDDRWDKLIRVRNQLMKMTLVTGLLLYAFVEFAIMMNVGTETLKAATILFFVGGLVGLFSRLYDQSKTDTSIEDFRLATARLIAAPLYSGLSAIGGVLVVQRMFELNVSSLLIAAAFGLTPSLFTTAIQKEADQYKTDLKSTTAPTGEKRKNSS